MTIKEYIESGILEAYVLGAASDEEARELLQLKKQYPEVRDALYQLETDLERLAQNMSIPPPPGMLTRIEESINDLVIAPSTEIRSKGRDYQYKKFDGGNQFIEVEAESSHIRIHKAWKWVFAAVFLLSKIFLIAFIYYYLENRHAQEQIQQLKTELKQYHTVR